MSASLNGIIGVLTNAGVGAAGAVGVDMVMGQVNRFLPVSMNTRYTTGGTENWGNRGVKVGVALAIGMLAPRFLPGNLRRYAEMAALGSLTVQGAEVLRGVIPADLVTLGYVNPAYVPTRPQNVVTLPPPMERGMNGANGTAGPPRSRMPTRTISPTFVPR